VTTISAERPETEVAVVLGVDTHLDFHVAVAVDHLGRRLGESYQVLLNSSASHATSGHQW